MDGTTKGVILQTCKWHARIGTRMKVYKGTCGHAGNTHVGKTLTRKLFIGTHIK